MEARLYSASTEPILPAERLKELGLIEKYAGLPALRLEAEHIRQRGQQQNSADRNGGINLPAIISKLLTLALPQIERDLIERADALSSDNIPEVTRLKYPDSYQCLLVAENMKQELEDAGVTVSFPTLCSLSPVAVHAVCSFRASMKGLLIKTREHIDALRQEATDNVQGNEAAIPLLTNILANEMRTVMEAGTGAASDPAAEH